MSLWGSERDGYIKGTRMTGRKRLKNESSRGCEVKRVPTIARGRENENEREGENGRERARERERGRENEKKKGKRQKHRAKDPRNQIIKFLSLCTVAFSIIISLYKKNTHTMNSKHYV